MSRKKKLPSIDDHFIIHENKFFSYAISVDGKIISFCFFNKYCYTNIFGFEIL